MFANCERNAKAKKLSRVRLSQPLGSVMTGRRKPEGKISECNEVGAASKAAIQQVKVLPCQLLVSDT